MPPGIASSKASGRRRLSGLIAASVGLGFLIALGMHVLDPHRLVTVDTAGTEPARKASTPVRSAAAEAARPLPVTTPPRPTADVPKVSIQRGTGVWLLELERVPLPAAVAELARASNAIVAGSEHLRAEPVSLKWQGSDLAAAWRVLLTSTPNTTISCGTPCRIWISSASLRPLLSEPPRPTLNEGEIDVNPPMD